MTDKTDQTDQKEKPSFTDYTFYVILEFVYSIFLGVCVNTIADYVAKFFGFGPTVKMGFQLGLIIIVLYYVKGLLFRPDGIWQEYDAAGVLFIALFLRAQTNITDFITCVYGGK